MRLFKPNLKKMEQKRDIDGLTRLFSTEKDYRICNEACEALGRIGLQAEHSLLILLGYRDDDVRLYASYALANLYEYEKRTSMPELALTAIHQSTRDSAGTVRQNAAFSLWFIGNASSIPFLIPMLDDQYTKARVVAPHALHDIASRIGDHPAFQPAYQPLLRMLRSDSEEGCRQNAAWALCALANPIAIEGLTAALKDAHQPTRMNAVIGLKQIAHPATLPGLVSALHDSSVEVGKKACEALEKLDLPEAIPALEIAANDRDQSVAQAANAALSALKGRHPRERAAPASAGTTPASTQPSTFTLDNILNSPLFEWRDGQFTFMKDASLVHDLNAQHRAAVAWFRSQNFPIPKLEDELVAEYLYAMGLQAQQAGVVQEAWGGLHEALEKYLALRNLPKIAGCYYSLGRVYGVKKDLWLANALFQQAAYLTHAHGTPEKEAWALTFLGMSSSDLGLNPLAREAYERAHKIFQQIDPAQADKIAQLLDELPVEPAAAAHSAPPAVEPQLSNEAAIREAITRLDLRPRELEILHPEKSEAIEFLRAHCDEALEPMLGALKTAGDTSRTILLYLLGETRTPVALQALVEALSHNNLNVRYEAIKAIHSYPGSALQDSATVAAIQKAAADQEFDVRKVAAEILTSLGKQPVREVHWAAGASTWDQIAGNFIRSQIHQPSPDFRGLGECLKPFSAAERHGAWIHVAQELESSNPDMAIRCYIEALANDPDPNSVAWSWLCGECNPKLRVLKPSRPHSAQTVAELKTRYKIF